MITTIITLSIIAILWILSDTITEFLSNGKSFAPNETKWN
jgi:hypothetical protein